MFCFDSLLTLGRKREFGNIGSLTHTLCSPFQGPKIALRNQISNAPAPSLFFFRTGIVKIIKYERLHYYFYNYCNSVIIYNPIPNNEASRMRLIPKAYRHYYYY